ANQMVSGGGTMPITDERRCAIAGAPFRSDVFSLLHYDDMGGGGRAGTAAWAQRDKEGSASRGQPRGADLRVDLNLSFAEAVWGTNKDLKVTREVTSSTSGGSNPGARTHPETSTLNVTVPPGVEEGNTLRLRGKGEAAPGGTTGDLYVVLHVQLDDRFERNHADVVTEVRISSRTATHGGEVNVPTLDDHCNGTATIAIKPETKSDEVIVRRGKGIPRIAEPSKRGDHLLRIKVELPSSN
ncbi:MAG TPA: J domain-containing protein, partial [Kofleriaceae bacterium]